MKYQAVIFDLDGTLLDTINDLADGVNYALKAHSLPERTVDEVRTFVGNGVANLIKKSVPQGSSPELCDKVLATFRPYYAEHSRVKTCPYDGIMHVLDTLCASGVKMAIVSNKFHAAVQELNTFYFGSRIELAIGETPDIRRKPAPDSILHALEVLGVKPEKAVYIGDSEVDVKTAMNAGVDCISVTWGFRSRELLLEHGASLLADTPSELISLLTD